MQLDLVTLWGTELDEKSEEPQRLMLVEALLDTQNWRPQGDGQVRPKHRRYITIRKFLFRQYPQKYL